MFPRFGNSIPTLSYLREYGLHYILFWAICTLWGPCSGPNSFRRMFAKIWGGHCCPVQDLILFKEDRIVGCRWKRKIKWGMCVCTFKWLSRAMCWDEYLNCFKRNIAWQKEICPESTKERLRFCSLRRGQKASSHLEVFLHKRQFQGPLDSMSDLISHARQSPRMKIIKLTCRKNKNIIALFTCTGTHEHQSPIILLFLHHTLLWAGVIQHVTIQPFLGIMADCF